MCRHALYARRPCLCAATAMVRISAHVGRCNSLRPWRSFGWASGARCLQSCGCSHAACCQSRLAHCSSHGGMPLSRTSLKTRALYALGLSVKGDDSPQTRAPDTRPVLVVLSVRRTASSNHTGGHSQSGGWQGGWVGVRWKRVNAPDEQIEPRKCGQPTGALRPGVGRRKLE